MSKSTSPNRIAEIRSSLGWSQEQLARACDPPTSQPQIERLEKGSRKLTQQWMTKLATAFGSGFQPKDLLPGETKLGLQPMTKRTVNDQPDVASNMVFAPDAPPMFTSKRDLPVLGHTKAGGDMIFIDNGVVAGMEYRPPELLGILDAYACEVHGSSMEPRLEQGWILYVHPRRALRAGKDVVVQYLDGRAIIKTLVKMNDQEITLRQYCPAKDFKVKRDEIRSIHLVVGIRP